MEDRKIRKLSRAQLIEIIYQLQLNLEELENENKVLKEKLEEKRIRIKKAGNIAKAALEINDVMEATQKAADLYLDEIREMKIETKDKCVHILKTVTQKADEYLALMKEKYEKENL